MKRKMNYALVITSKKNYAFVYKQLAHIQVTMVAHMAYGLWQ
jgi:hypothetical protein